MSYIGKQPIRTALTSSDIEDGVITAAKIEDGTVVAAEIASNAVTTAKINADAVTAAKIADDVINSEHIVADSIDAEHYAAGSVDTTALGADAVTGAKIADDAVDSEHYTDGSIDTAHIAADQITNAKIADDQIDSEHYVDGSIDTAHIADVNVTQGKIADQAINEAKMQISNAPSNGYFLSAQSGNTGGLTWAEAGGGIEMVDQYRITANKSGSGLLNANWERSDTYGAGFIGTGMTESSGVFSFPSTGIYFITAGSYILSSNSYTYGGFQIQVTADNSNYNTATEAYTTDNTHGTELGLFVQYIFDVTNTSNDKFRINSRAVSNNCTYQGSTSVNKTWVSAFRLGDT